MIRKYCWLFWYTLHFRSRMRFPWHVSWQSAKSAWVNHNAKTPEESVHLQIQSVLEAMQNEKDRRNRRGN